METPDSQPEEIRRTVLIVDDAPINIKIIIRLLKDEYHTLVATSGQKALETARAERPPDLVLLDVMMPDMDGFEVCKALKADPQTRDIPVLFLTGKFDSEDEIKGFGAGCADFVTKPISPLILKARVKTHLMLVEAREFYRQHQGSA